MKFIRDFLKSINSSIIIILTTLYTYNLYILSSFYKSLKGLLI